MTREIERKFLVRSLDFKTEASHFYRIRQGFLNKDPQRTVRVRLFDGGGKLTVKGPSSENGISRLEWETPISVTDAVALLALCEAGQIDKTRYLVPHGSLQFEVDVFHGDNEGLILAEIELPDETTAFEKPHWLDAEVTGDIRYYNSHLSDYPFSSWF
jgi:CYTH domain-containing protein